MNDCVGAVADGAIGYPKRVMLQMAKPIERCPRERRPAALRRLHEQLPPSGQEELVAALKVAPLDDEAYWDGLLIAGGTADPNAAAWVQPASGNTAVLWPPTPSSPDSRALLEAVGRFAEARRLPLVQLLAVDGQPIDLPGLQASGFVQLARLCYMAAPPRPAGPRHATAAADPLEFVARAGEQPTRLGEAISRTYVGTQDCPTLDGCRSLTDVLDGYRAQGRHLPDQWYLVRRRSQDVGVLLLTSHPATKNWELVYMGVSAAARGAAIGSRIVEFALAAAHAAGAEQLVLAVDAANRPARDIYRKAGFRCWDERTVFGRVESAGLRIRAQSDDKAD